MAGKVTFERAVSAVFALSAAAVAGVFVVRAVREYPPMAGRLPAAVAPVYMIGWEQEVVRGIRLGPDDASVTIMEFIDFECPFCRRHAARMDTLRAEFPDDVQVIVHHFPLALYRRVCSPSRHCPDSPNS